MKRMIKPLRITPTAFDSRVSVMQAAEVGGEVEKFRVEEDGLERGLKKQQVTERTGEKWWHCSKVVVLTDPRGRHPTPVSSAPSHN